LTTAAPARTISPSFNAVSVGSTVALRINDKRKREISNSTCNDLKTQLSETCENSNMTMCDSVGLTSFIDSYVKTTVSF
jgi:hypothetical protein